MQSKQGILWVKTSVVVTFLIMITANALANIVPINGVSTGQVSDAYQNLFTPAGFIFPSGASSIFWWQDMCYTRWDFFRRIKKALKLNYCIEPVLCSQYPRW